MAAPVDRLQKLYRQYSRDTVYSYAEHVALAEKLDKEGKLPSTFMVVAAWELDGGGLGRREPPCGP